MTRVFISLCSALFLCLANLSCIAQPKLENSLLWKISGNGLEKDSYLFGTNHNVHYSFLDSVSGFWNYFTIADNLVVEIDITDENHSKNLFKAMMVKETFLPKDTTYTLLYSNEQRMVIENITNTYGLGPLSGINAKPNVVVMLVSMIISNVNSSVKVEDFMEPHIILLAKQQNKPLLQLDNINELAESVLSANKVYAPIEEQAETLYEFAKNFNNPQKIVTDFEYHYRQQDMKYISTFGDSLDNTAIKLDNVLRTNRNHKWMEELSAMLGKGSCMIAVGVRHLVGEDGLIELLRKEGYIVEPVVQNKN